MAERARNNTASVVVPRVSRKCLSFPPFVMWPPFPLLDHQRSCEVRLIARKLSGVCMRRRLHVRTVRMRHTESSGVFPDNRRCWPDVCRDEHKLCDSGHWPVAGTSCHCAAQGHSKCKTDSANTLIPPEPALFPIPRTRECTAICIGVGSAVHLRNTSDAELWAGPLRLSCLSYSVGRQPSNRER